MNRKKIWPKGGGHSLLPWTTEEKAKHFQQGGRKVFGALFGKSEGKHGNKTPTKKWDCGERTT